MGAGKTNSAILASRVVDSNLTVIVTPNAVVEGWRDAILGMYPDSSVATKTFEPGWGPGAKHCFLVLNFEMFQQPDSQARLRKFLREHTPDFIVLDEIQFVKQRAEKVSKRRKMVGALLSGATRKNKLLYVLGMSGTPVINNLREGVALIEMVTGKVHKDLDVRPTISNCQRIYQKFTTTGVRWRAESMTECVEKIVDVDCTDYLEEIQDLLTTRGRKKNLILDLEEILTRARIPTILKEIKKKTVIYTHYVGGDDRLDRQLYDAVEGAGWRAAFYTGENKEGLDGFLFGNVDVLIASSPIGTGLDGLQAVCNRMIVNVLPWTAAEKDQLVARLHRQGQLKKVAVIIPCTYIPSEEWSLDRYKLSLLRFKRSVADAAVDGVIPEGQFRSLEKVKEDLSNWIKRLSSGTHVVDRSELSFSFGEEKKAATPLRKFGDFSKMNSRWNRESGDVRHLRLASNPAEWRHYHTELDRIRPTWSADPQEHFIRWAKRRPGKVVGDFGCGRARVSEALKGKSTVYSFDHIAINDTVTACNMAKTPLKDESLDIAVFVTSLMGANPSDYIREAYRTLKLDGLLHLYEPTSRFSDRNHFLKELKNLGFGNLDCRDVGSFTHIVGMKTDYAPKGEETLTF